MSELLLLGSNAVTILAVAGLYYKVAKVEARLDTIDSNIVTHLSFKDGGNYAKKTYRSMANKAG